MAVGGRRCRVCHFKACVCKRDTPKARAIRTALGKLERAQRLYARYLVSWGRGIAKHGDERGELPTGPWHFDLNDSLYARGRALEATEDAIRLGATMKELLR